MYIMISIITGKDLVHQDSFDIVMETPIWTAKNEY